MRASTALLLTAAVLLGCMHEGHAMCIQASDAACGALGRSACDPEGSQDLCGPCGFGTKDGPDDGISFQAPCVPITCPVNEDSNATPSTSLSEVMYGVTIQYNCNPGYLTPEGNGKAYSKYCDETGTLIGQAGCIPLTCPVANDVVNATATSLTPIPFPTAVVYNCLPGYATASNAASFTRTCTTKGTLSAPDKCIAFDACLTAEPCGTNALCVDLPPPSLGYECRCSAGYIGTPRRDALGCHRMSIDTEDAVVTATALDIELFQPTEDVRVSLRAVVADISTAGTAIAQATAAIADADRVVGSRIDDTNRRVDTLSAAVAAEVSRARAAEAALAAAATAEVSRATAAEAAIQSSVTKLGTDIPALRADVNAEVARATSTETSIAAALGTRLSALAASLTSEVTRATSTEASIQASITTQTTTFNTLRTDLNNEITRAKSVETAVSTSVSTTASAYALTNSAYATLSTAHAATQSMVVAVDTAIKAEATRAQGVEAGLTASINTLRTDLTSTQTVLAAVSGTVSGHTVSVSTMNSNIAVIISSTASLVTAISTASLNLAGVNTNVATQSTVVTTLTANVASQSTRIATLSTAVATAQTTTNSLSTTIGSLGTTITSTNSLLGTVNSKVGLMTAGTCNTGNGEFLFGYDTAGNRRCAQMPYSYLRNWYYGKCWVSMGWRDSCNGCGATPAKWVTQYPGGGACKANVGASNYCANGGWASVNTDGTVGDDDNFYVQSQCDV